MTQPRYEFWRPITPVIGEPIPDGAQYYSGEPGEGEWFFFGMAYPQNFAASHMRLPWRAPVEVIPLDVAVDAVYCNCESNPAKHCYEVEVNGKRIESKHLSEMPVLIAEALRKAAK